MSNKEKIFDIYLTNISIVRNDQRQPNMTDRSQTAKTLQIFIEKETVLCELDQEFGLISLVKIPVFCKRHDGNTFIAFLRFERQEKHAEALLII
jgi:hypothetical protein